MGQEPAKSLAMMLSQRWAHLPTTHTYTDCEGPTNKGPLACQSTQQGLCPHFQEEKAAQAVKRGRDAKAEGYQVIAEPLRKEIEKHNTNLFFFSWGRKKAKKEIGVKVPAR